ncbi:hypothetical protein L798_09250 [Zootermopsis nevadensis]|uniref:Uncharacterized protein n=1 Tax=Zootermopsis nevadensis TaxID=136037 RepID=A0A067R250_ZOONE|nr:hypothetical protein L798_09250 [Zootermopsis nevadensis]
MNISDPNFSEFILGVINKDDSKAIDYDESNEDLQSEHDTESKLEEEREQEEAEDHGNSEDLQSGGRKAFYGQENYKLSIQEPKQNVRTPSHNIVPPTWHKR